MGQLVKIFHAFYWNPRYFTVAGHYSLLGIIFSPLSINLPSSPRSSKGLFSVPSDQNVTSISLLFLTCYIPSLSYPLIWQRLQIMKLFVIHYLQPLLASLVLGPNILSAGRQDANRRRNQSGLPRSFRKVTINTKSLDSSVSIVTRVRAGRQRNEGNIPGTIKPFFSSLRYLYRDHSPHLMPRLIISGATPPQPPYALAVCTGASFS